MALKPFVTETEVIEFYGILTKCKNEWGFKNVITIRHFDDHEDFINFIVCGLLEDDDRPHLYHVNCFEGPLRIVE